MPDPQPAEDLELRRVQTEALLNLTRIRHTSERRVEVLLAEVGLTDVTPAQANALMVLFQARRPLTAARMAEELALSEVTVGRFVRALEGAGWIERWRDPADSRQVLLRPTDRARAALPRFIAVSNTLLDEAFAGMDRATIEAIGHLVEGVRRNLAR